MRPAHLALNDSIRFAFAVGDSTLSLLVSKSGSCRVSAQRSAYSSGSNDIAVDLGVLENKNKKKEQSIDEEKTEKLFRAFLCCEIQAMEFGFI